MRHILVLLSAGLATGLASAQLPAPGQVPTMPGTPVGRPLLLPAGSQIPAAAPAAGQRIGTGAGGLPSTLDPRAPMPPGQVIDLKNVIAPYPGQPNPEKTFWDRLVERWEELLNPTPPPPVPPSWTPGIGRRNRERAQERKWRRD